MVTLDGSPVSLGETTAKTGLLEVTSAGPFTLYNNSTEWTPIETDGDTKKYIVNSDGIFKIVADGKAFFWWWNNITIDYSFDVMALVEYRGEGAYYENVTRDNQYYQGAFGANFIDHVRLRISPDIADKELSFNQTQAVVERGTEGSWYAIHLRNVNSAQPLWVTYGGRLLAFLTPFE